MNELLVALMSIVFAIPALGLNVPTAKSGELTTVKPDTVLINGYIGNRLERNLLGILMHKDEQALLDGFRNRTVGGHPWIGEHVGKWLSAASMMYEYSKNQDMHAKLKRVAHGLIDTQLEDGYLGTYGPPEHWKRWDIWVHKYNLLGLLAYYDVTEDKQALIACRKMADLIISNFGPDKKDIIKAGLHEGMAATSILEPFVKLYLRTGEAHYLAFADYIVEALEHNNGPHIVSTLLKERSVSKVANAKAYEMISNIMGLLAMYRIKGNEEYLKVAEIAFEDIVKNRTYITGGASYGEAFQDKDYLPNAGHVAETCVLMSQLQLAKELLLLTGKVDYGHTIEHLVLNHVLSCQHPSGESICYYNPLWGRKFYMTSLDCCISSGPRAVAIIPSVYYLRSKDKVVVNLLGASELKTELANGETPHIIQETDYPFSNSVTIRAIAPQNIGYTLALRIPPLENQPRVTLNGVTSREKPTSDKYMEFKVGSEKIEIVLDFGYMWKIIKGTGANDGLFALQHGPVFFAYDYAANSDASPSVYNTYEMDLKELSPRLYKQDGQWIAEVSGYNGDGLRRRFKLLPYMDAGQDTYFSVWLRDHAQRERNLLSMFTQAHESVSRKGSNRGSIADNCTNTFSSTDNGGKLAEDYFEVNAGWRCEFNIIVFHHGKTLPNGGWFDTSKGKPRVQIHLPGGGFKDVAVLENYPDTTAEDPGLLRDQQAFRVVIPKEKRENAFGVRIVGVPAHGNNPDQNFATCSELKVFYDPQQ